MGINQTLSREQILELLSPAVTAQDAAQIRLLVEKNAALEAEAISPYDMILASNCPYKARVYKAIMSVGTEKLTSLKLGMEVMQKWENVLEFILLNDCTKFVACFGKSPIRKISKTRRMVSITPAPLRFFCSDSVNKNVWDTSELSWRLEDLNSLMNKPIETWYEKEKGEDYLPF